MLSLAALPKVTLPSKVASVVNCVPPTVVTSPVRLTGPGNDVVMPAEPTVIAVAVVPPTVRVPAVALSTAPSTARVEPFHVRPALPPKAPALLNCTDVSGAAGDVVAGAEDVQAPAPLLVRTLLSAPGRAMPVPPLAAGTMPVRLMSGFAPPLDAIGALAVTLLTAPPPPPPIGCHAAPSQMYHAWSARDTRTSPSSLPMRGSAAKLATSGRTAHSPIHSPSIHVCFGGKLARLSSCVRMRSFQFCIVTCAGIVTCKRFGGNSKPARDSSSSLPLPVPLAGTTTGEW